MPTEFLAYIGAAAMVVLAFLAYRYWRSTAAYAHRVRESHARQIRDSYRATAASEEVIPDPEADLPEARTDQAVPSPAFRLIEDLEPRQTTARASSLGPVAELLKELDEELAALPKGIELMNLPLLERRRVADRREQLTKDRSRLLDQPQKGNHRRSRRRSPGSVQ